MMHRTVRVSLILLSALLFARQAGADVSARIADVTHLKGQRINKLVGIGLVTGLRGTGDGADYEAAMRPLAEMLKRLGNPMISIDELAGTKNVAIVMVEAVIGENGAREGDRIDAQVTAFGAAKSLRGGRLMATPLIDHQMGQNRVFAYASGPVRLLEDTVETTGTIDGGVVLEQDVLLGFLAAGDMLPFSNPWIEREGIYFTLVIDDPHAGWAMAAAIAETVNTELSIVTEGRQVALAADNRNVVVQIPGFQLDDPVSWIRDVEMLMPLLPEAEARVIINRKSRTMVITGDVKISPVVVSQEGLTVTVLTPELAPDAQNPKIDRHSFVPVDPGGQGGASMSDLLEALNQLKVPMDDRIAIVEQIFKLGKLHAKLIVEE